jgi:cell division protein FtsQ
LTTIQVEPEAAAIDPRLRARRISVRRDAGRRRLRRLGWLGAIAAAIVLAVGVTRSPVLDVDRVQVSGATHTSADTIRTATGIKKHEPMTDVDLAKARAGVLALPWVKTVSIKRNWPASVSVVVTERTAIAVIAAGPAGFALVDGDGRVLELSPAPTPGYVMLANLPVPGAPGTTIDASAGDVLAVARVLPPTLREKVSTVVAEPDGVALRLVAGGVVHLGPATDLAVKLRDADTVLAEVDTKNLCAVDVRVPGAPSLTRGKSCL